jgi:hypothetical protein
MLGRLPFKPVGSLSRMRYAETPMGFEVSRSAYSTMTLFFSLQSTRPMLG